MTSVEGLSDGAVSPAQCHRHSSTDHGIEQVYGPGGRRPPWGDSLLVTPSSSNGSVVKSHLIASV